MDQETPNLDMLNMGLQFAIDWLWGATYLLMATAVLIYAYYFLVIRRNRGGAGQISPVQVPIESAEEPAQNQVASDQMRKEDHG